MASVGGSLKMGSCAKEIIMQIELRGERRFKARLWIGMQIVRFGVWVIGLGGVEVSSNGDHAM